ncbi:MAG: zinc ribbon domain-containing protein [Spirochaetes bacterium]|nr:zinc ribbon domain-containing protein [Spirochaetota bacterium]
MPIYEFKCADCGNEFSEIRRIGEDKGVPCPSCSSVKTIKKISAFASISTGGNTPTCSHGAGGG